MATRPTKSDLADSVQIALDAADTATGVTEVQLHQRTI